MTEVHPAPSPARLRRGGAWGVLAVVTGALFLEGIDIAMLNVAVPSIAADIGLGEGSAHWVISAYVLAYAGFMILGGRAADILGRRRVFLVALAIFVLFSLLGGLAQDAGTLILVRFITGATAGFMTPAGFGLLTASFAEGPLRNKALAIYGAIGASGFLLGVVVGGLLTSAGWRWVFFAPALIGAAFFVVGMIAIPKGDPEDRASGRFDLASAITLTTAMVSLVFGIVTLGEDLSSPLGIAAIVAAVALFVAFGVLERRVADPLIPPGVLSTGLLPWTSLVGMLFIGAFFSWQFLLTLYLQQLLGWGPLETGLAFAAMGVEVVIAPWLTPWLVGRFGNVPVMIAGLASVAIAFALTLGVDGSTGFLDLLAPLLLLGLAFALIYGPLTAAAVEGVEESAHGVAGGVVYTGFQFGAALGVSIATIVLVAGSDGAAALDDYQRALLVPAIAAALALVLGVATFARHRALTSERR